MTFTRVLSIGEYRFAEDILAKWKGVMCDILIQHIHLNYLFYQL